MSDKRPDPDRASDVSTPTLELAVGVRQSILNHAQDGGNHEVCGVLGGTHGSERSVVSCAEQATNAASAPERTYEIDPAELFSVIERIEEGGDEVVGFYHSHPRGPARPSETDRRKAAWPGYSYVIVVPGPDQILRSWRWTGDSFVREQVTPTDNG